MNRVAALVLLVGGALLMSWAVAPASPTPRLGPIRGSADEPPVVQHAPGQDPSANMTAEVERLRARLAAPAAYPAPTRDLFRFGARPVRTARNAPETTAAVEPAAPVLPRLVAIVNDGVPGRPAWRAVMAIGDDVRVLKAGETVGGLELRTINADGAELFDPISSRTFRVVLK